MSDRPVSSEPLTAALARDLTEFSLYVKTARTLISDRTFPPRTVYATPEGLHSEDEETRAALDVQGGIYPIRESVFRASYAPDDAARSATPSSEEDGLTITDDPDYFPNTEYERGYADGRAAATPDNAGRSPIDVELLAEALDTTYDIDGAPVRLTLMSPDGTAWTKDEAEYEYGSRIANSIAARLSESTGSEEGR